MDKPVLPASRGRYINTGVGPRLVPLSIDHPEYVAFVDPDTAFWALVSTDNVAACIQKQELLPKLAQKRSSLESEMRDLRFNVTPSAVYFNLTDRCNLNCTYCYIPESMRRNGRHMTFDELCRALDILMEFFERILPAGRKPELIFHGAEPLLNRDVLFAGIEKYREHFRFGIQTNGTLLDEQSVAFLSSYGVGIGVSLDGHQANVADRTRKTWAGEGAFEKVENALRILRGYHNYNVLCTVTTENVTELVPLVEFLHELQVPVCMLNPVRCSNDSAKTVKPTDQDIVPYYIRALDRTYELYKATGRKLIVANFANILLAIVAPTARRLLCDISPCGGGRAFFAVTANGDLFPCSEFVGMREFCGGNLFRDNLGEVLQKEPFQRVTGRIVEDIPGCSSCAIRHFCGSPCPAEAYHQNGSLKSPGAFCELYEELVRYAFRLIADGKENDYLFDGWDTDTETVIDLTATL